MNPIFSIKNPTQKDLRKFGITLFIAFGILGGLFLWKKGNIGLLFLSLSGFFLFYGLIIPNFLRYIYIFWMKLAALIGFIMSHLILTIIYYFIVTPTGLVMRLIGRDPLSLKSVERTKSYWIEKEEKQIMRERYEKMF